MAADLVPLPHALLDRLARVVDIDAVLRRAEVPRSRFRVARPVGSTAEFFALWREVEKAGCAADLALRLGADVLADYDDVAVLAALHSATLGEGLEKFARYKRLICPEKVRIEIEEDEARLRFEWFLADTIPPALVTDLLFAFMLSVAERGTGERIKPRRVELARRRANESILRRHFRCEVQFDAPHDVMVFDEATLALPMQSRNEQLFSILMPGLELAIAEEERGSSLIRDVRSALTEMMCGARPSIAKLAKNLGMSARTMQRRLGELGATYQGVLDEVRRQAARRLLANTDLASGEIAFLLGFEEVNSFKRAFQTWEGVGPSKWREDEGVRDRTIRRKNRRAATSRRH